MALTEDEKFMNIMQQKQKLLARLKDGAIINKNGCRVTRGFRQKSGHVQIRISTGTAKTQFTAMAHKIAWIIEHGTMPQNGDVVRHKCNNAQCSNPDHLTIGSIRDNNIDVVKSGSHHTAKLSPDDVRYIRNNKHIPKKELALKFNVHESAIQRVLSGRCYSWVK